jgi:predicted acylesterase/phospholipase RssA
MSLYDHPDTNIPKSVNNPYDIDFLVFAGAGVRGAVYCGVYKSLYKRGLVDNVKYWVGCSAGSIIATMGAMGASSEFVERQIQNVNLASMMDIGGKVSQDHNTVSRYWSGGVELLSRLGIARGEKLVEWFKQVFIELGYPTNITFSQLYDITGKHLVLVTTSLNTFETLYASRSSYPNAAVLDFLHASVIIPYLIQPILLKDPLIDVARLLVDGGLLDNYPINVCDVLDPTGRLFGVNRKVVGFITLVNGKWTADNTEIKSFMQFAMCITNALHRKLHILQSHQPYFWERTVPIITDNIDSDNFDITKEQQLKLVKDGFIATETFLNKRLDVITQHGHYPGNLFIPVGNHKMTNDEITNTQIYQTNPEQSKMNKAAPWA